MDLAGSVLRTRAISAIERVVRATINYLIFQVPCPVETREKGRASAGCGPRGLAEPAFYPVSRSTADPEARVRPAA
jgi:hypothetical protein